VVEVWYQVHPNASECLTVLQMWNRRTELELMSRARSREKYSCRDGSGDIAILLLYLDQSNKLGMNFRTGKILQVLAPAELPSARLKL
jgi:hypothetical protein